MNSLAAHADGSVGALALSEADDIRVLEVKKNRFDGQLGSVGLRFDKKLKRMVEMDPKEVRAFVL